MAGDVASKVDVHSTDVFADAVENGIGKGTEGVGFEGGVVLDGTVRVGAGADSQPAHGKELQFHPCTCAPSQCESITTYVGQSR